MLTQVTSSIPLPATSCLQVENKRRSDESAFGLPAQKRSRIEYRRVACRARNTPPDHDEETAFFQIPSNATHGLLLGCSHPSCGGHRKRFRYCIVCKVPVSKRNFSSRHSHGIPMGSSSASLKAPSIVTIPSDGYCKPVLQGEELSGDEESDSVAEVSNASSKQHTLSRQEIEWLSLLRNRPDPSNTQAVQVWIKRIVTTADVNMSLPVPLAKEQKEVVPNMALSCMGDRALEAQNGETSRPKLVTDPLMELEVDTISDDSVANLDEIYSFDVEDVFIE